MGFRGHSSPEQGTKSCTMDDSDYYAFPSIKRCSRCIKSAAAGCLAGPAAFQLVSIFNCHLKTERTDYE